ncbi:hypothetical protein [Pseudomonas guariconensis]|uniref:hypothetical protein n=1 Tax=Pseudomonas guariconensis TaxID=1288410 RepID=UPI0018AC0ABD|nr:hypothetical protein [Pseudomonas guariconensis]MBF8721772.1 hypothetical protein [Pseudomonas guariconensis]
MNTIELKRKNAFNLFRESSKMGNYDEFPMLRSEVDPQLHVSKNTLSQPFYLICEKDSVVTALSGNAQVHFKSMPVLYYDLTPGDFIYVPGGVEHRIVCEEESIHVRYKAKEAGLEAIVWHCESCGAELDRHTWSNETKLPQEGYSFGSNRFNEEVERRTCGDCGVVHPPVELSLFRWNDVAVALKD